MATKPGGADWVDSGPAPITYAPSVRNRQSKPKDETYTYAQRIQDSYRLGWMGSALNYAREDFAGGWGEAVAGYDGLQHVPVGYEDFADAFAFADSPERSAEIKRTIDGNIDARERRMQLTFSQAFGDDLVTGLFDPTNLIPGARLVGQGARVGALKGAVSVGALATGQAVIAHGADPTSSPEELKYGIAGGVIVGSAFGAVLGRVGRAGDRATARTRLPLPGGPARVTSGFGLRRAPKKGASSNHKGIDLDYAAGHPLKAQADGKVTVKRTPKGGNEVHIDYGNGVEVAMLHLGSVSVRSGQRVKAGDLVGAVGATGNVTGPHLHYQVKVNGKAVDPMGRVEVGGVVNSPAAAYDMSAGIVIPDSVLIGGEDIPVRVATELGEPKLVRGDPAALVGEAARRSAADLGDDPDALIADFLAAGNQPRRIPRGRRTIDPRKWSDTALDEVPEELPVQRGDRLRVMAQNLEDSIDELLLSPRFDEEAKASKSWRTAIARELGEDGMTPAEALMRFDKQAFAVMQRSAATLTKGEVLDVLRARVAWLREQAGPVADDIDPQTGEVIVGSRTAGEADDAVSHGTRPLTEDEIELRAQRAAEMRQLTDDGEIAELRADRPMGRRSNVVRQGLEAEPRPPEGVEDEFVIDPGYIRATFKDAPWTGTVLSDGRVMQADTLTSMGEYAQFTLQRAVNMADGMPPDEAARAALQAVEEGTGAFVPEGSLRDAAIAPSPMRQMKSLVPHDADIQRSLYQLAGDGAVVLEANAEGRAAAQGGSVMMRQALWMRHLYDIRDGIRTSWLEAMGSTPARNRVLKELQLLRQRGLRLSGGLDAFRLETGRAIVGFEDVSPMARKAADVWIKVMEKVEKGAREAGLFTDSTRLQGLADQAETALARLEKRAAEMKERGTMSEIMEQVLAGARVRAEQTRAAADAPLASKFERNHFSRLWDKGALLADREGAVNALEIAYKADGSANPRADAEGAYNFLITDPEGELHAPGTPGFVKARSIPISNKDAWNWIVQDPETVAMIYLRRMGGAIEMTRMFGDPFGSIELDRLAADLIDRGVEADKVQGALQIWEDARDRIVGGFHGKDPLSWDNRAVRAMRAATQIELMGASIKSQLSDVARIILTQGAGVRFALGDKNAPPGLITALFASLAGDVSKFNPGGPAKLAGEAMEIVTARASMRLIEADDALVVTHQSGIERGLAAAVAPFHVASLLLPFTVMLKEFTGVLAAHNLIADARLVAAGEAGADKAIRRLAMQGVEPDMARKLAGMPVEQGESGLHLINIEAWEDPDAVQAMLGAVYGETRRTVVTPSALDKPAIMDGVTHNRQGWLDQEQKILEATGRVAELKDRLADVADLDDNHPAKREILDALREEAGSLKMLRRERGRAGRNENPFLALPFFLRSYGIAAGGKSLHGLLSGVDRNRLGGIMSLLAAGWLAWYWKQNGNVKDATLAEHVTGSLDNSGIPAWLGDLAKSIDTTMNLGLIPGQERDEEGETISDELGGISAAAGMFDRLARPFVAPEGDDNVHDVRRAIPLNNAIYLKWLFDSLEHAVDGRDTPEAMEDKYQQQGGDPMRTLDGEPIEGNGVDFGRGAIEPAGQARPAEPEVDFIEVGNSTVDKSILEDIDVLMEVLDDDDFKARVVKRQSAAARKANKKRKGKVRKSKLAG